MELRSKLGEGLGSSTRWVMLQDLKRRGVRSLTATRIVGLSEKGVHVQGAGNAEEVIPADAIVLALGARPNNPLEAEVRQRGIEAKVVGDAGKIADAFQAVHQGFLAGASL